MSLITVQTPSQTREIHNPTFAWRKSTARFYRGPVHVFPGIGRSACGKIERGRKDYAYGDDFPKTKSLCQRCNWHLQHDYLNQS